MGAKVPDWRRDPESWRRRCRNEFFKGWLDQLPAEGWSATPTEVARSLEDYCVQYRHWYALPEAQGVARWLDGFRAVFEETGWWWRERRTGGRRLIEFRRISQL